MPYRPTTASNSATPPKMLNSVALVRMIHKSTLPSRCCRMVFSSSTGSAASPPRISLRTLSSMPDSEPTFRWMCISDRYSAPNGVYTCGSSPRKTMCSRTFATIPTTSTSRALPAPSSNRMCLPRPSPSGQRRLAARRSSTTAVPPAASPGRNVRPRSNAIPIVLEVVRTHDVGAAVDQISIVGGVATRAPYVAPIAHHAEGDRVGERRRLHAGQSFQAIEQRAISFPAASLVVTGESCVQFHHDGVVDAESRSHIAGAQGGAREQTGRDQQREREADLTHHQKVAAGEETFSAAPAARAKIGRAHV